MISKTLIASLVLAYSLSATAGTIEGRIVSIADGDTVTILNAANKQTSKQANKQTKIRLMGIDAPEKAQAFGARSKQSLSDLVFNKEVIIEFTKQNKYGRTIAPARCHHRLGVRSCINTIYPGEN